MKNNFKTVTIEWIDGGSTSMTVHYKTNVLLAYDPVLKYCKRITEIVIDKTALKKTVIYEKEV